MPVPPTLLLQIRKETFIVLITWPCRCCCGICMCSIGRCEARWVFRIHRCKRGCAWRLARKSATADEYTLCHAFCRLVSVNECFRSNERPHNKLCTSLTIISFCTTGCMLPISLACCLCLGNRRQHSLSQQWDVRNYGKLEEMIIMQLLLSFGSQLQFISSSIFTSRVSTPQHLRVWPEAA
jgi:hypothetical protein